MKSLLVIDDTEIRKNAFAKAEKLIGKLEKLEQALKTFQEEDQRLYTNWYNLTFRVRLEELSLLRREIDEHYEFNNWIVAESRRQKISQPAAYLFLRAEQELYEAASPDARAMIDERRRARNDYIRQQFEGKAKRHSEGEEERADDPWAHGSEQIDDETNREPPPLGKEDALLLQTIQELTPEKIERICRVRYNADELLTQALSLMRTPDHYPTFLRIWDLTPEKIQKSFAREFWRDTGIPFSVIVNEMRESAQEQTKKQEPRPPVQEPERTRNAKASAEEELKLLYKKLVRKLHPDHQRSSQPSSWQMEMWHRVQAAFGRKDHRELDGLLKLIFIRGRELNSVTIGEIIEGQEWLEKEIKRVQSESRLNKKDLAWGFSTRRDIAPLKTKVDKNFAQQVMTLRMQIHEFNAQHTMLEAMAFSEAEEERRSPRTPSRRRSATGRRSGPRRGRASAY